MLLLLLGLPALVQAADYAFSINPDNTNTVTITDYTGAGGAVVVPSTIDGRSVTVIGSYAFEYCTSVTSVSLPNTVTRIGDLAFCNCWNLAGATLGTNVTTLGSFAFGYCLSLTNITFPKGGTTLGDSVLCGCSHLAGASIPGSVTSIGSGAFDRCTSLQAISVDPLNAAYCSVDGVLFNKGTNTLIQCPGGREGIFTVPGGVTHIDDYAFDSCASLTGIVMPASVISIGSSAFNGCASLADITIPRNVTSIGSDAFASCGSLTAIVVDALNSTYSSVDGVLYDKAVSTLIQCPAGKVGCIIPSGVTSIGSHAFADCTSLTSVTMPSSVTSIGSYAFYDCTSLAGVTIPRNVTSIGDRAFYYCTSLTCVCFQGNLPSLGAYVFNLTPATLYYLPGSTGWNTPVSGRPVVLWNAQIRKDAVFGVRTNRFGFNIAGTSNLMLVVEACTNPASPAWTRLSTNTLNIFTGTNGMSYFSDPQWSQQPGRFYRLRTP
jgi:hypothetical protein